MPRRSSILPSLELVMPILCEMEGCEQGEKPFNMVFVPVDEEESFCEAFGQGGEDPDKDNCPHCAELGVLQDPHALFFYSTYMNEANYTVALRMSLDFVETLQRILKNAHEEGGKAHEKVYLASDKGNEFFDDFHVFEMGDESVFASGDFDYDCPDFNERSKVAIVTKDGICLSCDISTKGDNEQDLGTVKTCVFSNADLAELNSWIVKRLGTERE